MADQFKFNPFTAKFDIVPTVSTVTVGTEATILALTPTSGDMAYSTDTQFFYVADGTNWRRASLKFYTDSANPDMGATQNNSKDGYYAAFITDKGLTNCYIGTNAGTTEGSIWVDNTVTPKKLRIYLNSTSNTILIDFSTSLGYLIHTPFSTTQPVKVWSGMSSEIGLNGRPMINEYTQSMGAYPPPKVINGGTF